MKPLPCPFCGDADPEIRPEFPHYDGNAWGAVVCTNPDCPTYDDLLVQGVSGGDL